MLIYVLTTAHKSEAITTTPAQNKVGNTQRCLMRTTNRALTLKQALKGDMLKEPEINAENCSSIYCPPSRWNRKDEWACHST
jgi:hypothetical protein